MLLPQGPVVSYEAPGQAKAALEYLVRLNALKLAGRGINVNCIVPGYTDTDAWSKARRAGRGGRGGARGGGGVGASRQACACRQRLHRWVPQGPPYLGRQIDGHMPGLRKLAWCSPSPARMPPQCRWRSSAARQLQKR